jgi:thiol-disulfide isomerase/thioredoxin
VPYDFGAKFESGLAYKAFLDKYANPEQRQRWDDTHAAMKLTLDQRSLLESFVREMKVLVLTGAWCGDCINQCPAFERFAEATPTIKVRYFDRDVDADVAAELHTCGAPRVPCVVFLSEDGQFCARYGDRTLSKYRKLMGNVGGATCPTGLLTAEDERNAVVQDWLNEFERVHAMLRTSSRLRQKHGD